MGYDGEFTLVDPHDLYGHFERDYEELSAVVDAMGDETPKAVRGAQERLEAAIEVSDGLELPPEHNSFEKFAHTLLFTPSLFGRAALRRGGSFWLHSRKDGKVIGRWVPEFLEEHTERGAELWQKLVGNADDATYRIEFRDETYLFETEWNGFLYGAELSELAEELRPVLRETDAFYADVTDRLDHQPYTCQLRMIDTIAILCEQAHDDELLVYTYGY